ncbi:polysaccharide deacetylase family protein [Ramlibacter sp. AW1]|uniref:Polysaccharide deacetylase family protein n=1 Tax=Ramlibacter aurantiacus TaxID=2801330 RepID=A0A936ZTA1_9BURK|nr:polysaccharide deacetylase family protein [Ramlibacter aurantiacus]MBL0422156.1 polysaccharide deacetylase family protein [Ramlibacter aurantiacus]
MSHTHDDAVRMTRPILILMYHQVGTLAPLAGSLEEVLMPRERFARQMAAMHALGYRGLSLTQLEPYLRGEKKGRVFGVTMDDGYVDCLHHAVPVLQRHGFSATCFAVSGAAFNEWDASAGVPRLQLMGALELKAWIAAGNDVGAHTRTHRRLPELDDTTARQEIVGCKQELEAMTGAEVRHFSYPFGDFLPQHEDMVHEAGFVTACTSVERRASRWDPLLALPRITAYPDTAPWQLWRHALLGTENLRGWVRQVRDRRRAAVAVPAA